MFALAYACAADQDHHLPGEIPRYTEHDAALIFMGLAINDQLRARVGHEILRC
jgi:hypothetical protein